MGVKVGEIDCPIAAMVGHARRADLCRQGSKNQRYYIRSDAGTLQCITGTGQGYINDLIKNGGVDWLPEHEPSHPEKPPLAKKPEAKKALDQKKPLDTEPVPDKKLEKGFFSNFFDDEGED